MKLQCNSRSHTRGDMTLEAYIVCVYCVCVSKCLGSVAFKLLVARPQIETVLQCDL